MGLSCFSRFPLNPPFPPLLHTKCVQLFYMLHSMFEKALHIVWLSPKYRDSVPMDWADDGICPGSGYTDELPFTGGLSFRCRRFVKNRTFTFFSVSTVRRKRTSR